MEEDWLMRQIKLAGEGIGIVLKKKVSVNQLKEIQISDGKTISRIDLIMNHMALSQYEEAFLLVNALKYQLSVYDFEQVSGWFISLLLTAQKEGVNTLDDETIERYRELLSSLL
ncbi:hypothetical protein NRIC_07080 [Enterococcus florum]|uniref:Uncharacterized protein n=1 Tax=Enterococcus florum TaxID=2480627 RepID=A0A4P5P4S0_9ENTE|nr:hypothetical protein [Enterococcus florum]GCF92817.1 hypothetical protein NRIC_07080 [Enterococcus florum]